MFLVFTTKMEELENGSIESSVLPFSSYTDEIFQPPTVFPCIGEQYQAVIPPLIVEYNHLATMNESNNWEAMDNLPKFVPSTLMESWEDPECSSFVLGLYIFGKKFIILQKFVRIKTMCDIISYYYGPFYSSDEYRRWSRSRKSSNRWCINGKKIFTGRRQQELLCRLSSRVSIESQNRLLELSQSYGEGKMSLENYVFALKDLVGMDILTEAIGIGKGKKDLTRKAMESKNVNHGSSVHLPCSMLTSSEIIKILSGDFRLSKTRCNDLFREAVWPRLLARGWCSEQTNQQIMAGSKESLIFLLPGVKKLPKSQLLKGIHYFNSVSDVLLKVASEPGLLESEIDDEKLGQSHFMSRDRDPLKFLVVDTSMADRDGLKMRGLRCLPSETIRIAHSSSDSMEMEGDRTQKPEVKSEDDSDMTRNKVSLDDSDCIVKDLTSRDRDFQREKPTSDGEHVSSNEINCLLLDFEVSPELVLHKNSKNGLKITQNPQSMELFDLNLPQIGTDSASDEALMAEKGELWPSIKNKQRPMRNRPLTTKALEAFEHEFFNENKKRKNGIRPNNIKSKPFRQKRESYKCQ